MAEIMAACDNSNQERRRPIQALKKGIGSLSTNGAHTNLNEYPRAAQLKKVTAERETPASLNQSDKLEKMSSIGMPAENPSNNMIHTEGSRHHLNELGRVSCVFVATLEVIFEHQWSVV